MKRRLFYSVLVLPLFLGACHKKDNNTAVAPVLAPYPNDLDIPYSTAGVAAVFSTHVLFDSAVAGKQGKIYYRCSSFSLSDSTTIIANGNELAYSGKIYQGAEKGYAPSTELKISWLLKGNKDFNFVYTDNDVFPLCNMKFPDTITTGVNSTFSFDKGNTAGMDTMVLKVFAPASDGSITVHTFTAGYKNPKISIPSSVQYSILKKNVRVSISIFNHRELITNGRKCIFIKQYTISDYIWFRQ